MNITHKIKNIAQYTPFWLGSQLAKIPFRYRLGKEYEKYSKLIRSHQDQEHYVTTAFQQIVQYATDNIPFYYDLYSKHGLKNLQITCLSDIDKLPIITKSMIREHQEEFSGALKLNTGGTSGEPMSLYVDKHAFAREWAHMHHVWAMRDYNFRDIKITLRGKNIGSDIYRYNPVHNEYIVNTYLDAKRYKNVLIDLFRKRNIKYLHGYPSAVFGFLRELDEVITQSEKNTISKSITSCLLGSEFPPKHILDYIRECWGLEYISWYGHSEMCILAHDSSKQGKYRPYFTYGYSEVVDNRLVGTSYHNYDMPLIRYDTGDRAEAHLRSNGMLDYFTITEGREGDFIIDKNNKKIPLTALIHGRHHAAFDFIRHVQVKQNGVGSITLYVTTESDNRSRLKGAFDFSDVKIDYNFIIINEPHRTRSGKVPLKIPSL